MKVEELAAGVVPYGRRIRELAAAHPGAVAVIGVGTDGTEHTITWRDLDDMSNRAARILDDHARQGSVVVVGLRNGLDHYRWSIGAWKLGKTVLALSPRLPAHERDAILELARPAAVVSEWSDIAGLSPEAWRDTDDATPMVPDRVGVPGRAVASGGSTGRSKIILLPEPMAAKPGDLGALATMGGMGNGDVQLVVGPLSHNMPNAWSYLGLFHDGTAVVMERFDAELAVDLIERHRVSFSAMVPTHMSRIAKLPGIDDRDLSSISSILHSAAVCPAWLKRRWFDLVGPEKIREGFGSTEAVGHTIIRGDEWLERPGSVGKPMGCELRILDEEGHDLPPGEVGEIFFRNHADAPSYEYIGAPRARTTDDGFVSVGDLGWVDEDGYLYVADRRVDLIITGGSNVYPAEVEAALLEHEAVGDVAVVGLADADLGRRVHAIVQLRDGYRVDEEALRDHVRGRLVGYKVPTSIEIVSALPRDDAGKIRRSDLVREREITK